MSTPVDHRVTPSLHPQNVKSIDGYDEETAPYLAATETAFDTAYQAVLSVISAREVAEKNKAWTEENRLMQMDALAKRKLAGATRMFDDVRGSLVKGIAALEQQLAQPLESKAAASIAGEIRSFVRAMPTEKRHAFMQKVIADGDITSAAAVLGAPAYLAGLDAQFQQVYTRSWNERQSPAVAKRLKAMVGARELIERNAPTVFAAMEKAVGGTSTRANRIREANAAAEAAFKDVA